MRAGWIFAVLVALVLCVPCVVVASQGGEHQEETSSAVEVGNEICPVSGQKVDEMGPATKYEYDGKIYNFCCAACIETFKQDPEKYMAIVEKEMKEKEE